MSNKINWQDYPNFMKAEFDCHETGENEMQARFMDKLQAFRTRWGKPITITSGYRSPRHRLEARKDRPGPHSTGLACDILVQPGAEVHEFLRLAFQFGFTGIGISQKNGLPRFIHLDICERRAVWSY